MQTSKIMKEYRFDSTATDACKGVGLLLLLWHHLFYTYPEYGYFTYAAAQSAQVCVAIFVLLSGYGLSEAIKGKSVGLFMFYKTRLTRLYLNYWFIAALFIPIGTFFMNRTLDSVYVRYKYIKLIINMMGLNMYVMGGGGYNATWWYINLIMSLYILFPFINDLIKKYGVWFLLFCLLLLFPTGIEIPVLQVWILPFAFGIFMSHSNGFVSISSLLNKTGIMRFAILTCLIIATALFREHGFLLTKTKIDCLFGCLIIVLTVEIINSFYILKILLSFLGKHLFNIFLFHTFIYLYYWKEMIYFFRYPLLIFIVLLSVCLFISVLIEISKKRILFYKLSKAIENINIPDKIRI